MKNKNPYQEALRYIDNAENTLKLAGKDGKYYSDDKYVKSASGIAYSGVLLALDALFDFKNMPKRRGRKAIDYYQNNLAKIDKKLLKELNITYAVLHLEGYYEGQTKIGVIEEGFDSAMTIIEAIKPFSTNGVGKDISNS
jgi:hypothetical protein